MLLTAAKCALLWVNLLLIAVKSAMEAASEDEAHASDVSIRMDEGATDPGSPLGGVDKRTDGVVLVPERSSNLARTNGRWSPVGGGVFIRVDEGATDPAPPVRRWAGGLDERVNVVSEARSDRRS